MIKKINMIIFLLILSLFFGCKPLTVSAETSDVKYPKTQKLLVLPIGFSNTEFMLSEDEWNNRIFGSFGKTVNNYYRNNSLGKFEFVAAEETFGCHNDGIVKVILPYADPTQHPSESGQYPPTLETVIKDSLIEAGKFVDFASYDTDGNGRITSNELLICAIVAQKVKGSSGPITTFINPHFRDGMDIIKQDSANLPPDNFSPDDQNNRGVTLNGKLVCSPPQNKLFEEDLESLYSLAGGIVIVPEIYCDKLLDRAVLCHELLHGIGIDDYYDYSGETAGVGGYCLMGGGRAGDVGDKDWPSDTPVNLNPWSRIRLGFVTPQEVTEDGGYELQSAWTGKYNVLKVPTADPSSFYLLENRQLNGNDTGLKSSVCETVYGGLNIWHVDLKGNSNNKKPHIISVVEADAVKYGYSKLDMGYYFKRTKGFFSSDYVPEYMTEDRVRIEANSPSGSVTMKVIITGITPDMVEASRKNVIEMHKITLGDKPFLDTIFEPGEIYQSGIMVRNPNKAAFEMEYKIEYLKDNSWMTLMQGAKKSGGASLEYLSVDFRIPSNIDFGWDNIRFEWAVVPNPNIAIIGKEKAYLTIDVLDKDKCEKLNMQ